MSPKTAAILLRATRKKFTVPDVQTGGKVSQIPGAGPLRQSLLDRLRAVGFPRSGLFLVYKALLVLLLKYGISLWGGSIYKCGQGSPGAIHAVLGLRKRLMMNRP